MGLIDIVATAHSTAPPAAVFAVLEDTETWPTWALQDHTELDREGTEHRQGVGAIRRMNTGRYHLREEVVAYDPPRRFGYRLLSGMPVHDYQAEVTLEPVDGGTDIRWHSTFRPKYPGTGALLRRRMQQILTDTSEALARHAAEG